MSNLVARRTTPALGIVFVVLVLASLVGFAPGSAWAESLQRGTGYCNFNFSTVTLTYSWSGHFEGGNEICVLPITIDIPPGECRHLSPPAGFTVSDFIVISSILRGEDSGGFTVCDPPGKTRLSYVDIPCAAPGQKVHGFTFIGGDGDYGPFFSSEPMTMAGFDADGTPIVVQAEVDPATQQPVFTNEADHCLQPKTPTTRTVSNGEVVSNLEANTVNRICGRITIGPPPVGHREPPQRMDRRQ